jgi:serine/threonine-protein kinase
MALPDVPLAAQQAMIALNEGRSIALHEVLGRGTTATVYRGTLEGAWGITRDVAVKVYDAMASDDHDFVVATLARATGHAARIRHPNVVQAFEFGMLDSLRPFVVSELVHGRDLGALLDHYAQRGRRLPLDLTLFVGAEIAEALGAARTVPRMCGHPPDLIHGALSAREVMLSWFGEVKLTDFGIASAVRGGSSIHRVQNLARRAIGMAPEVARGRAPDARADVFSVGVLLWEMLIGPRFPTALSDAEALAYARDGFVLSTVFDPHLPPDLKALLRRALELDPARRFPHTLALAFELRKVGLSMGVADGRVFLRKALTEAFRADAEEQEVTRDFDRFAIERESLPPVDEDDDDGLDPPAFALPSFEFFFGDDEAGANDTVDEELGAVGRLALALAEDDEVEEPDVLLPEPDLASPEAVDAPRDTDVGTSFAVDVGSDLPRVEDGDRAPLFESGEDGRISSDMRPRAPSLPETFGLRASGEVPKKPSSSSAPPRPASGPPKPPLPTRAPSIPDAGPRPSLHDGRPAPLLRAELPRPPVPQNPERSVLLPPPPPPRRSMPSISDGAMTASALPPPGPAAQAPPSTRVPPPPASDVVLNGKPLPNAPPRPEPRRQSDEVTAVRPPPASNAASAKPPESGPTKTGDAVSSESDRSSGTIRRAAPRSIGDM